MILRQAKVFMKHFPLVDCDEDFEDIDQYICIDDQISAIVFGWAD